MATKTITLLNEKGGVGKTTLAITLAAAAARDGMRVLMIDSDPQATGTMALGHKKQPGFYNLIQRGDAWADLLVEVDQKRIAPVANGSLHLLPGNVETRNLSIDDAGLLLDRLEEVESHFDLVVIDTAPTPSLIHILIYSATSAIIYPTQLESFSVDGIAASMKNLRRYSQYRQLNGMSEILGIGIVPTITNLNTNEHVANLRELGKTNLPILKPIHRRITWPEASAARQSIFAFAPGSPAANDAEAFYQAVAQAMTAAEV
jgi:chromosome partitioning protein